MRPALDVIWETLHDWYNGMVGLAIMNLVWLLAGLTVILLPPATAGMYAVTYSIARGTGSRFEDFAAGARAYLWVSLRWGLVNALVGTLFVVNFAFYGATETPFGLFTQLVLLSMGLLWITTQFYVWPFLMVQDKKRLRIALKNGLFLALANPVYTLLMLGMVGLALLLSLALILPIALFATSFISLLGNRAVIERLKTYGILPDLYPVSGDE